MVVSSELRTHKVMEATIRELMGAGTPPRFKFKDTYASIEFPEGYTVPAQATLEAKYNELLALEEDIQKTAIEGDLEVGTSNLFVDTETGRVGIGVTNPLNSLIVQGKTTIGTGASTTNSQYHDGTLNVIGGGARAILRVENNSSVGDPAIILGEGGVFTENTVPTIKKIAGTNNLSIMTAGNVGIGKTNPAYKLDVTGDMYATGNIAAYSDKRAKSDIQKIENALDKIEQLNGYTFSMNDKRYTGVIAQEVLPVLPEAVTGSEDTNYAVAYGNMIGLLIEAIKELKQKLS